MNFKRTEEEELNIGLTPLIDVVFILLLFFMVTTTFNKFSELKIELPEATAVSDPEKKKSLEIAIDAKGKFYVNGKAVRNNKANSLLVAIKSEIGNDRDMPVSIRADGTADLQLAITAMDAASKLGLNHIAIATSQTQE